MRSRKTPTPAPSPGLVIRRVPLSALHPDPDNANTHDARNLAAIVTSLTAYGQVEPLVVQAGTGRVIGGNGRLEAMASMGWAECDVVEVAVDGARAAALGLMLNRSASLSSFDESALIRTLEAIRSEPGLPIEATGFDDAEVDAMLRSIAAGIAGDAPPPEGPDPESTDAPKSAGPAYPLAITLTRAQYQSWKSKKAGLGLSGDTPAFLRLADLEG